MFGTLLLLRGVFNDTSFELYPLYLLIGLITFNLFRKSTSGSASSFFGNGRFLTSINFPKFSLVLASILNTLISHAFELLLLVVTMIYFSIPLWHIFLYIPFLIVFFIFITGISQVLSVTSVYINDLKNVWSIFTRILWLATPIFYIVPKIHFLSVYNPLAYFVRSSRSVLMDGVLLTVDFGIIIIFAIVSISVGTFIFKKVSPLITEAL